MTLTAIKDPADVVDYEIDWSDILAASSPQDTITSSTWTADGGVRVNSDSETSDTTTVWVSGGGLGVYANLTNRISTADGRTYERTIVLKLQNT